MNDNPPPSDDSSGQNTSSEDRFSAGSPPTGYGDWREQRRAERYARHQARRERRLSGGMGWIGGAVLILIGLVLLFQNLAGFYFVNWWALFILIPALGALGSAWNNYRNAGRLDNAGMGSLILGLVLTVVALAFLFGLDFTYLGPALLILGGLALLFGAFKSR